MTQINRVAAQDVGRICALSDGIFAVAATLIVLEIRIPQLENIHSQAELISGLIALWPRIASWLLSVMTLGIFWIGQQTHLNYLERADRDLTWLHWIFLIFVSVLPFSTRLLAEYFFYEAAFIVYWLNILLCGLSLLLCAIYAQRAGLLRSDAPPHFTHAFVRRIVIAQALYAVSAGLLMFSGPVGITFMLMAQLNYAFAPRIPFLWRL